MWLVSGVDEEHRFREWTEAAAFYRQMVGDWIAAHGDSHGGVAQAVDELRTGQSHQVAFAAPEADDSDTDGGPAFQLGWERAHVGLDHYTAC